VTFVAGGDFALIITSFGLPWIAARYLPEFRLRANGKLLAHFVWQIIAWICLFSVGGALLLFVALPQLLVFMDLAQQTDVARLYLLVWMLESVRVNVQANILEPLMQQGQAQLSQIMRNLGLLLCLGVMVAVQGKIHLRDVVLAELAGTFLGTVSALLRLVWHLPKYRDLPGKDGWRSPNWLEMWPTARHMYFSHLISLTYSSSVLVFLVQRFLGIEATALFGFILNVNGQISRYLPATLLFGLVRPKLIASYVGEGGEEQLTRDANLIGKMSLFVLMPLLVFVWFAGGELLSLLSGGKFSQAGYYLGGVLLSLIPLSQRQIIETVAVASGKSNLCLWASFLGILTLPLVYGLFELGFGLWSPIIAMVVGQLLFNATLVITMMITTAYRPDTVGFFKLTVAAFVGIVLCVLTRMAWEGSLLPYVNGFVRLPTEIQAILLIIPAHQTALPTEWLGLILMAVLACSIFLMVSYFIKPFRLEERVRLNRLLNRNVFVW
jgi:O-antigen/teichoic acid export membrane protein